MIKKIKLNRHYIEALVLILTLSIFIWFGLATSWQHKISHDLPVNFRAADAFWNTEFANYLKQRGSYDVYGAYYSGGYDDAVAHLPPMMYHISVIFSNMSGIEVYDSIYFFLYVSILISILTAYILVRKFNWHIAVLSLPACFLVFTNPFDVGISWGQWSFLIGSLFVLPVFFSFGMLEVKGAWMLFAAFFTGLMLTNFPQFGIVGFFIFLYLTVNFFINKSKVFSMIRKLILSGIVVLIFSIYWLIIFASTLGSTVPFLSTVKPLRSEVGFAVVVFSDLGFIGWFVLLGVVISVFFLLKKKSFPIYVFLFMFFIGFGNYFLFGKRSLQLRFLWPIYSSIFIGILLYFVLKLIIRKCNYLCSAGLFFILLVSMIWFSYKGPVTGGLMDPYHWESLNWIKDTTPPDSKIVYFYGDSFSQKSPLSSSQRLSYLIGISDLAESFENKTMRRDLLSELIDEGSSGFAYRKSAFSFGYHAIEDSKTNIVIGNKRRDICSFYDYFVFDKLSSYQPALAQLNMLVREELLKHDFKEVFSNNIVSVLQNTNKGADCIG